MATKNTTPAAPVEKAAPAFTFGDAPVPESTRTASTVNPMMEACKAILSTYVEADGKSTLAKTVTAPDEKTVKSIKRWLTEASAALGYTFRSTVDENNVVTFWAVKKIVHRTAEEKAAEEAAKAAK